MDGDINIPGNTNADYLTFDINEITVKKFRKNIPVLIIRSMYDTTVRPIIIGAYAKAIQNTNGNCQLLTYNDENIRHVTITDTPVIGKIAGYNIKSGLYNIIKFLYLNGGYDVNNIEMI